MKFKRPEDPIKKALDEQLLNLLDTVSSEDEFDDTIIKLTEELNSREEFDATSSKLVSAIAELDGLRSKDQEIKLNALVKLYELRSKEKLNIDAVVNGIVHLAGIVVILQHERVHVIASKAFGLIKKIV